LERVHLGAKVLEAWDIGRKMGTFVPFFGGVSTEKVSMAPERPVLKIEGRKVATPSGEN